MTTKPQCACGPQGFPPCGECWQRLDDYARRAMAQRLGIRIGVRTPDREYHEPLRRRA
jgi:hypothetical protein